MLFNSYVHLYVNEYHCIWDDWECEQANNAMLRCEHVGKFAQEDGKASVGAWIEAEVEVRWNCLLQWGIQSSGSETGTEVLTSADQKCNWRCGAGNEKTITLESNWEIQKKELRNWNIFVKCANSTCAPTVFSYMQYLKQHKVSIQIHLSKKLRKYSNINCQ